VAPTHASVYIPPGGHLAAISIDILNSLLYQVLPSFNFLSHLFHSLHGHKLFFFFTTAGLHTHARVMFYGVPFPNHFRAGICTRMQALRHTLAQHFGLCRPYNMVLHSTRYIYTHSVSYHTGKFTATYAQPWTWALLVPNLLVFCINIKKPRLYAFSFKMVSFLLHVYIWLHGPILMSRIRTFLLYPSHLPMNNSRP